MDTEIYLAIQYRDGLQHHGIKGQKWGDQNGPPYPLGSGQKSSAEKKASGGGSTGQKKTNALLHPIKARKEKKEAKRIAKEEKRKAKEERKIQEAKAKAEAEKKEKEIWEAERETLNVQKKHGY